LIKKAKCDSDLSGNDGVAIIGVFYAALIYLTGDDDCYKIVDENLAK